jgi:hypothetical protein
VNYTNAFWTISSWLMWWQQYTQPFVAIDIIVMKSHTDWPATPQTCICFRIRTLNEGISDIFENMMNCMPNHQKPVGKWRRHRICDPRYEQSKLSGNPDTWRAILAQYQDVFLHSKTSMRGTPEFNCQQLLVLFASNGEAERMTKIIHSMSAD